MSARILGPTIALALATAAFTPVLAQELPLATLYKNLAEKNYYPALEGLTSAQADVTSNILDHLVATFPDPTGKPLGVKFYWSKVSPDSALKRKFAFIGAETLTTKAKQRFQIAPDDVINAPIHETMQIAKATIAAGRIRVTAQAPDIKGMVLDIDRSTWQVQKMEADLGVAKGVFEVTSKVLGGKWVVDSTVFSAPPYKRIVKYEYTQVEGFWLPSRISVDSGIWFEERNGTKLLPPFVFDFSGWQLNKGIPEAIFQ